MEKISKGEKLSGLPVVNEHVAGIDVGSMLLAVTYTNKSGFKCFCMTGCFTRDLEELVELFVDEGITDAAMEATGVYWIALYQLLEKAGINVLLINPSHYKKTDEPKTDERDSRWIHLYHSCGIFRKSHIAGELYRDLRDYVSERDKIRTAKSETLTHMQTLFAKMNVKFQHVVSDVEGVGAMKIIRAIANGTADPETLVELLDPKRFKASREDLVASLKGLYTPHLTRLLSRNLNYYDYCVEQMIPYDTDIEEALKKIAENTTGIPDLAVSQKTAHARKNQYTINAKDRLKHICGIDLTTAEGFDEKMLTDIVCVTGTDMSKWPTAGHFASWLNLSPRHKQSGGKFVGYERRKTKNRATQAFRNCARTVGFNSKGPLGKNYRRIAAKKGAKTANKATARKMAVLFYTLLKNKLPYDPKMSEIREKKAEENKERRLLNLAKKLGYTVKKIA